MISRRQQRRLRRAEARTARKHARALATERQQRDQRWQDVAAARETIAHARPRALIWGGLALAWLTLELWLVVVTTPSGYVIAMALAWFFVVALGFTHAAEWRAARQALRRLADVEPRSQNR